MKTIFKLTGATEAITTKAWHRLNSIHIRPFRGSDTMIMVMGVDRLASIDEMRKELNMNEITITEHRKI